MPPAAFPHDPPAYLLLPLASGVLYVFGALSLKRAAGHGAGVWRTTFVSNWTTALFFAPLALLYAPGPGPTPLWQPAVIGLLYVGGQAATMFSLNRGDVSIATPVVGTKVVFVAFFATLLLSARLGADLWLSAGMSAAAIALLNRGTRAGHHHVAATVASALAAAACYALFDVLVTKWAAAWGTGRLLAAIFGFGAVGSVAFLPILERPALRPPPPSRGPMFLGSALIAVQSLLLVTTIARFGDTTRINVIYNSRGLWSVLAVWLVGHWWGNTERHAGPGVFAWRIAGAAMMLAAILTAVLRPAAAAFGW